MGVRKEGNEMTHTIRMPRLKSNLLAMMSLIVLCSMMFLTFTSVALACGCAIELAAYQAATRAYNDAKEDYDGATAALQYAYEVRPINMALINSAIQLHKDAKEALDNAKALLTAATKVYLDCLDKCNSGSGSGGCDSGGCG